MLIRDQNADRLYAMSFVDESWPSGLRQEAIVSSYLSHGNTLAIKLPLGRSQGCPIAGQDTPGSTTPRCTVASLQFEASSGWYMDWKFYMLARVLKPRQHGL